MAKADEHVARERVAKAIREYATRAGRSLNQVAKELDIPRATLDTHVGSSRRPIAANIPRGSTLQAIARKTGYSLDYLFGFDVPELRDQTRTVAALDEDIAAHVKRAIVAQIGPPQTMLGERHEWVVVGRYALQWVVDHAIEQARAVTEPTVQRTIVYDVITKDEPPAESPAKRRKR
ncbi:MAG: helix-turn-helix transcriptional regulator [Gemmatimonadaceae bacterium]|nr:helix-turn-helix transcriptional regulator [Gemmatimonadaceae bacterium]